MKKLLLLLLTLVILAPAAAEVICQYNDNSYLLAGTIFTIEQLEFSTDGDIQMGSIIRIDGILQTNQTTLIDAAYVETTLTTSDPDDGTEEFEESTSLTVPSTFEEKQSVTFTEFITIDSDGQWSFVPVFNVNDSEIRLTSCVVEFYQAPDEDLTLTMTPDNPRIGTTVVLTARATTAVEKLRIREGSNTLQECNTQVCSTSFQFDEEKLYRFRASYFTDDNDLVESEFIKVDIEGELDAPEIDYTLTPIAPKQYEAVYIQANIDDKSAVPTVEFIVNEKVENTCATSRCFFKYTSNDSTFEFSIRAVDEWGNVNLLTDRVNLYANPEFEEQTPEVVVQETQTSQAQQEVQTSQPQDQTTLEFEVTQTPPVEQQETTDRFAIVAVVAIVVLGLVTVAIVGMMRLRKN